jgi:hypothetical protein
MSRQVDAGHSGGSNAHATDGAHSRFDGDSSSGDLDLPVAVSKPA